MLARLVTVERTVRARLVNLSIYSQKSNTITRRLATMNLAMPGIEADIGTEHTETLCRVEQADSAPRAMIEPFATARFQ